MAKNKHGLSRNIPSNIKFEVRKKSGFGCVVCGLGICDYEHIEPEFKDAKKHDPNGMTFLCIQCHGKKTRGFLNKETILEKMKSPKCLERNYVNENLDLDLNNHITVKLGNAHFTNCEVPIRFKNKDLIKIRKSTEGNNSFLLTCEFKDSTGNNSLKIVNNEWIANSDSWDLTAKAGEIIIKNKEEVFLIIKNIGNNVLYVKYFKTIIDNHLIIIDDNGLKVDSNMLSLFSINNCSVGIVIH